MYLPVYILGLFMTLFWSHWDRSAEGCREARVASEQSPEEEQENFPLNCLSPKLG